MAVYYKDNPEYLSQALESIFKQTLRPNEVVLVKDGSLGNQLEKVIELWKRKEGDILKIVQLDKNMGLASALNFGLEHCTCELVTRMDSDDISIENRFGQQVECFVKSDIDVLGSYIEERGEDMQHAIGIRKIPLTHDDIVRYSRWRNPMNHVSVVFKKKAVIYVGGYPDLRLFEDYGLWAKMIAAGYKFKNIPESLVIVRTGGEFFSRRGGFGYFKHEFALLKYLNHIGHIGIICFIANLLIRFFTRVSPTSWRRIVYKKLRDFNV